MGVYHPKTPTEFWCHCCDAKKVHSEHRNTGRFFCQFGHVWPGTGDEEYTAVIFALCPECEENYFTKIVKEE